MHVVRGLGEWRKRKSGRRPVLAEVTRFGWSGWFEEECSAICSGRGYLVMSVSALQEGLSSDRAFVDGHGFQP